MAAWFQPNDAGQGADLLAAIPDHFGFACSMNTRFDESMLRLYRDIGSRFIPFPNDATVKRELDGWLNDAVEVAKHYTGRMAFGMDFKNRAGRQGVAMVQITELDQILEGGR